MAVIFVVVVLGLVFFTGGIGHVGILVLVLLFLLSWLRGSKILIVRVSRCDGDGFVFIIEDDGSLHIALFNASCGSARHIGT